MRPQAGHAGRRRRSTSTSRTTAASTARPTAGRRGRRSRPAAVASSASRWRPIRATRRPSGRSRSRRRPGPLHARRRGRRVADERRRRHLGAPRRRACRRSTPTSACCARRWPSTASTRSASTSGRAPGQLYGTRGRGRLVAPDRRQPAADLVRRGGGRRLTGGPGHGRPAALAGRAVPRRGAAMRGGRGDGAPRVTRPRRAVAGHADRVLDPGPAGAGTSTCSSTASGRGARDAGAAGATVHVIPAVSGGSETATPWRSARSPRRRPSRSPAAGTGSSGTAPARARARAPSAAASSSPISTGSTA